MALSLVLQELLALLLRYFDHVSLSVKSWGSEFPLLVLLFSSALNNKRVARIPLSLRLCQWQTLLINYGTLAHGA